ncbi:unnamed protein product [Kuraishia capsulata CBS 1993]|uniref:Programmed cell death protein 2 C-terminal domain-containing protein n=1 Tax=Kuraishia capsulata CBS 1993 TaxID=1382522 RepID=W6MWL5_9ASCO|nr:uncharacterized protein KUCA_T00003599001 [Kuraishia capsulata CBS 1993]CDK27620.1 unnamed protein product [Kuraishia capsulata CBS 1993]
MSDEDFSDNESAISIRDGTTYLGFVDVPISEEEKPTIEDTFIGGEPLWLDSRSPPQEDLLLCKSCTSPMALLLQSYANLEATYYDRVLYVFACKKPGCRRQNGSVRALRAVRKDPKAMASWQEQVEKKAPVEATRFDISKEIFGSSSNPFTSDTPNPFSSSANPFAQPEPKQESISEPKTETKETQSTAKSDTPAKTYASVASSGVKPKPKPKPLSVKLPSHPGYILYMDAESLKRKPVEAPIGQIDESALDTEVEASNAQLNPLAKQMADMLDDSQFQKFSSKVAHNPHQVLRYDLGGKPLLYSSGDSVSKLFLDKKGRWRDEFLLARPGFNPSGQRRFELQLMPKAIIDLESDLENIDEGMEWGTIVVCTDVEDTMPELDENHVGYVEEYCGVQWEEEVKGGEQ